MIKIVDIFDELVDDMFLIDDFTITNVGTPGALYYEFTVGSGWISWIYEGLRMRVVDSTYGTVYGTIYSIDAVTEKVVVLMESTLDAGLTTTGLYVYVNYLHGHHLDIIKTLQEYTTSGNKGKEFPLVALLQDIEETVEVDGLQATASVTVVICTDTDPNYNSAQRYTNTFTPLLYPLYEEFIKQLRLSPYIASVSPEYKKIDRLYWGREGLFGNTGNIFDNYIDAIELTGIELRILRTC